MTMPNAFTRRGFLKAAGAGLVLGVVGGPGRSLAAVRPDGAGDAIVNLWLHIGADGRVVLYSNAQEMGQGAFSGVAQVLAEELRLPWEIVEVRQSPITPPYGVKDTSHWTGGSASIRRQWDGLRMAGAAAREMLIQAGAARLGVPVETCRAVDGRVVAGDGRALAYAALAADAAALPVPEKPRLTPRADWRLIGQPLPRKDLPEKVDGSAVFAVDVKLPGLLTATIRQSPVFGGRLVSVDPAPALAVRGVRHVVPITGVRFDVTSPRGPQPFEMADAVAVVADTWWAAKKGLDALRPVWDTAGIEPLDTRGVEALLRAGLDAEGEIMVAARGDDPAPLKTAHDEGMARAARIFTADYATPYLAHAHMEPLSAVAHVRPDAVEVWSGSQFATSIQRILSAMTGLPQESVQAHTLYSGGAFGRRYINDYVAQAGFISRAVGAPVKLIWSREEDFAQGRYRSATAARLTAGLDAAGLPTAIRIRTSDTRANSRFRVSAPGSPQPDHAPPYLIAASLTTGVRREEVRIPTGPWRAPVANAAAFYFESFVDELAAEAGIEPLDYRRRLLAGNPRALRVLEAAASAAGWGGRLPAGRGRGIAIFNSFQSICAQVAEVSVIEDRLSVHRVTCAIDCGTAVNPDSVRAQAEGSVIMALSATLAEKVDIRNGAVDTLNFDAYPILGLGQTPRIDVLILDSPDEPVGGVGEPMTPPLVPALTNAIFAATGRRIRTLPVSAHGLRLA